MSSFCCAEGPCTPVSYTHLDKLQGLLEDSEALRQAYDECLAEQMREKYVWFDAQTKEPQWVETDITKDQMFRDMLEGIIAEIPEEEIQTVRVIECSTGKMCIRDSLIMDISI